MKDIFKMCQLNHTGIGGLHCHCCNQFFSKFKKRLNRMARAKVKRELNKEIEENER